MFMLYLSKGEKYIENGAEKKISTEYYDVKKVKN